MNLIVLSFVSNSVDLKKDDPIWGKNNITLRINGTGCILHAYVNGEHIGKKIVITLIPHISIISGFFFLSDSFA